MNRDLLVKLAYEVISMDQEITTLRTEVKKLREYKAQRQEQDIKYANDSTNELSELLRVIFNDLK
jgi:hypothetical protein